MPHIVASPRLVFKQPIIEHRGVGALRRLILTALPKLALSRTTRVLAHLPLPRCTRAPLFRRYAKRYAANLQEIAGPLTDFRTFAAFFGRPLHSGARPIASAPFVWPADGRLIGAGAIAGGRLPQIKEVDYSLATLLADDSLGHELAGGSHGTVYLAPGDYHRVHAPFDAELLRSWRIPGGLFPVNPGAVRSIPNLFVRNERLVIEARLPDGRRAAVVLVAALNVSDTQVGCTIPGSIRKGDELGRFGLGSTVVVVVASGNPAFAAAEPGTRVRVGAGASG